MSGRRRQAKPAVGCPLDGGVMPGERRHGLQRRATALCISAAKRCAARGVGRMADACADLAARRCAFAQGQRSARSLHWHAYPLNFDLRLTRGLCFNKRSISTRTNERCLFRGPPMVRRPPADGRPAAPLPVPPQLRQDHCASENCVCNFAARANTANPRHGASLGIARGITFDMSGSRRLSARWRG
jgi:hypothetical protein